MANPMEDEATSACATAGNEDGGHGFHMDPKEQEGIQFPVTDDGGLQKKILTKGSGWDKPEKGDKVTVHYHGTLEDGSTFDSSKERNEPFVFTLGQGQVIKGWDVGVATMKLGEKSILTCVAEYAYGAQGSPPKIPPGATLDFEVELLSWQSVKDICGNGGVIKTVVVEPEGYMRPSERDEVLVTYSVRLHQPKEGAAPPAGQLITETGPEGVRFSIVDAESALQAGGKPAVLKGIVEAVKTMKKGEVVDLLLKPEYAYGSKGMEPDVPPGAVVNVHLELVRWNKVEDVSDDGGIMKKTLTEAEENTYKHPNEGSKVTLRYTARLSDGSIFDQHSEGSELVFITEEGQVTEGLERGVMRMCKGEVALLVVQPQYAFGSEGSASFSAPVPADATVCYEVELVDFENSKEQYEMSDEEKITAAGVRKEKGNKAFKEGKLEAASKAYNKAVAFLNYDKSFTDELKGQSKEVKKSCWLNLAAVQLKTMEWKDVKSNCGQVLEVDSSNVKALYRRAQAFAATQDYLEAEEDVKKGISYEPLNADLKSLMKKIKVLQKEQNAKASKMYSKMFAPRPSKPLYEADVPAKADEPADDAPEAPAAEPNVEELYIEEIGAA